MRTIGLLIILIVLFPIQLVNEKISFNKKEARGLNIPFSSFPGLLASAIQQKEIDTTALKQSGWYANTISSIEQAEYEIKFDNNKGSYSSPNRQHNIRSFYSSNIFTLLPRKSGNDDWRLELTTIGVYAEKKLIYTPVIDPTIIQDKNSIRFNHNEEFTTEYINSKEGVRQNFIIEKEPASKPQTINVKLKTNAGWLVNKVHDKEIHFAKEAATGYDKKITYNDLKAWDATGKELKSFFTTNKNSLSINVKTEDAVYPVTIDPLSTGTNGTPDWVGDDADQADANFGVSVASAGDVNGDGYSDVIIGAWLYDDGGNNNEGRAFVYHGSITGLSTLPNWIGDDADQANAFFAETVASAGDVNGDGYSDVIIGADNYDDGGNNNEGRAFVYHGSATGLSTVPDWIGDDADQANAFFGVSLNGAGDVNGDGYSDVIIGAIGYTDAGNSNEGRAFIYHGSASGLSNAPNSTPDDADQAGAFFGWSVAGAGDVNGDGYSDIIIGALSFDDAGNTDEGRAFVYHGSATGLNTVPGWIGDDANQVSAQFGECVASAGDVNGDGYSDVIIGARLYDDGGNADEGRAFVYYGSSAGLNNIPDNMPDDADQTGASFGISVACAGDINGDGYSDVIIGARLYDDGGNADEGRVFVYYGSSSGLSSLPNSTPDDANQSTAGYGYTVASAGDVNGDGYSDVIVGAYQYDDGGNPNEGAAFTYYGTPDGLSTGPLVINNVTQDQSGFGYCVNSAGDVNGDGYSDVIIGAVAYDDNGVDEGRAFVYYGSATGISIVANVILDEANQSTAYFSYSCAGVGDVNGDGYGDVIVGAHGYTSNTGRAYVYFGSAAGLLPVSNQQLSGVQSGEGFGISVSGAGDVNGDGYSDVVIGAYSFDDGANTNEGRAFIYHGSSTGLNTTAARIVSDANRAGAGFGFACSGAGDLNGDGYGDIIIGAGSYADAPFVAQGTAFIYYGSMSGIPATASLMLSSGIAGNNIYFGFACSGAGDINGDGFSDVVIGAFGYNSQRGRSYVYYGSNTGLSTTPTILENTVSGNNNGDRMGMSVGSAGDINGDGYSDIIIGIPEYSNPGGAAPKGRAYVYLGNPAGVATLPEIVITDNVNNQQFFGTSVACAGDVNADGISDIVVGGYKGSWPGFGMGWIYYGNDKGGLRNNLRLYNSDLVTPMNRANITDPNLFGAGLYSKSFIGRQKGKLVWQTVRNGNPFSGNPITNSTLSTAQQPTFTNLGLTGVELKSQVAKMVPTRQTYVRARVRYDLTTAITGQLYGPWRYPEGFLRGKREIADVALPVKFLSFTASKEKQSVLLKWITANEEPGVKYELQHSTDGIHFTSIHSATSQLLLRNEYDYPHIKPAAGNNFYRVRAYLHLKEAYSETRVINFSGFENKIQLYPNPVKQGESFSIILPNNVNEDVQVRVMNASGQQVFIKTYNSIVKIEIPVGNWNAGYYVADIRSGDQLLNSIKLIVQENR